MGAFNLRDGALRAVPQIVRVTAAFIMAVLAVGVVAAIIVLPFGDQSRWIGAWIAGKLATEVAAVVALTLGLPAYAMLRMFGRTSWRSYLAAGLVLSGLVTLLLGLGLNIVAGLATGAGLAVTFGLVGSLTFWLVARPDRSTRRQT
jgi:hypothetical protein